MTGRITSAGEDAALLDVDGTPREVRYADLTKALVQVELNRKLSDDEDDDEDAVDDETDDEDEDDS